MRAPMQLVAGEVVVVGSDRGGVGKTMTAEIVATRMELSGVVPIIIEVEAEPRLRDVFGSGYVNTIRISRHTPEAIERDPSLLYEVWDELGDAVLTANRPVVIDLGANLTRALAMYLNEVGQDGPFGLGEQLWFLGVTGSDRFSLNSLNYGLSYMSQVVPASHRWIVINEQNNRFSVASDSDAIQTMVRNHGVEGVMRLPACTSPALQVVVDAPMRVTSAAEQDADFWISKGYGNSESRRAVRKFRRFLVDAVDMLDPIFPYPEPARVAR